MVQVILRYFHLLLITCINCDTENTVNIGEVCTNTVNSKETGFGEVYNTEQ